MSCFDWRVTGRDSSLVRCNGCCYAVLSANAAAIAGSVPGNEQCNVRAAVIAFAISVCVHMIGILRCAVAAGGAGFRALMLRVICFRPRTIRIGVVCVIVCACAAAGTGLCAAVLGVRILAPRTGGIAVIAVIHCGISAGAARCRSTVLTAAVIAPRTVAHTVAGVFIIRIAAIPAVRFAPVLRG